MRNVYIILCSLWISLSYSQLSFENFAIQVFDDVYGSSADPNNYPAVNFPNPYFNLPSGNDGKKILNLTYLEFGDNVAAFYTGGSYLPPTITKAEAIARLLEAYNIAPNYSGSEPFNDVDFSTPYYGYIVSAFQYGFTFGNTGNTFNPYSSLTQNTLDDWLLWAPNPPPVLSLLQDISNYYIPGNYTPQNMSQSLGIEQGVFSHYAKNSFVIPDRKFSLNFSHYYNSFMAEMPENMYPIKPLSKGWTHTFNIYIYYQEVNNDDMYYIVWSDGTIDIYNDDDNEYESYSVYDDFDKINSSKIEIIKKDQTTFTFNKLDSGREIFYLTMIEDRNGNQLEIEYENAYEPDTKRIEYVEAPSGRRLNFNYKSNFAQYDWDLLDNITDPIGRIIEFEYTSVNSSQIVLPKFDEFRDAKAQVTEYHYMDNSFGNKTFFLEEIELPEGNVITNTYSSDDKLSTHQINNDDPIEVSLVYNYNSTNQFIESTVDVPLPNGSTLDIDYDFNVDGALTSIQSDVMDFTASYPSSGINRLRPNNSNSQGVEVDFTYDSDGNITHIETENSIDEYYNYNSDNTIDWYENGEGDRTYYEYDSDGNLTEIKDNNQVTRLTISYDSYGQVNIVTDGEGRSLDYDFNQYGMVSVINAPLSIQFSFSYDGVNRMTSKSHNGRTEYFQFDDNDNITLYTDPLNVTTTYFYDDNDNLLQVTNGNNNDIDLEYTNEDRLESEDFEGLVTNYDYNDDGTIDDIEKPSGTQLNFQYDNDGRLINSDATGSIDYDNNENIKEVDRNGYEIDMYYDNFNRLEEVIDRSNNNYAIGYYYDDNHVVEYLDYNNSTNVGVYYDKDIRGRVEEISMNIAGQSKTIAKYWYNDADQITHVRYGDNSAPQVNTYYFYEGAGRLRRIACSRSGIGYLYDINYIYDVWSNVIQMTYEGDTLATIPNFNTQGTVTYNYDNHNFINQASNINYVVSDDGNTTDEFIGGGTSIQLVYNDVDELIIYNPLGTDVSFFDYDGFGRRRKVTRNGSITRYVWDVLHDRVAYETTNGGTILFYYVYGAQGELICRIKPNGDIQNYHADMIGNVLFMTDESQNIINQYEYDDFGNILAMNETETNRYRQVGIYGVEYEAEDLYYMRARYYSPSLGRFITEDPIWSENLFPYANNNPIAYNDPDGEFANFVVGAGIGVLSGLVESAITGQKYTWKRALGDAALGAVGGGIGRAFKAGRGLYRSYRSYSSLSKGLAKYGMNTSKTFFSRESGTLGEKAVGFIGEKVRIPSITGSANYRITDGLTKTALSEVKNVNYLSYTSQLKDFHAFSQTTGRQFILYTRQSTQISGPLKSLINQNQITHRFIQGF